MRHVVALMLGMVLLLSGCGQSTKLVGEEANDLMNNIFSDLMDQDLGLLSGWVDEGEDKPVFKYEFREREMDYQALKKEIHKKYGKAFELDFIMIPFPEDPMISGIIRKIEGTDILIVESASDWTSADGNPYYSALRVTTNDRTVFEALDGQPIALEDLRVGMAVDSYDRGMVLDSYPGQAGCEKLVVQDTNGIKHVSDLVTEAEYTNKYLEADITQGLLIMDWLAFDPVDLEGDGKKSLRMWVDYGFEHYAYADDLLTPVLYELKCFFTVEGIASEDEVRYVLDQVMMTPGDDLVIEDADGDGLMEIVLTIWAEGALLEKHFEIQSDGQIDGMEKRVY